MVIRQETFGPVTLGNISARGGHSWKRPNGICRSAFSTEEGQQARLATHPGNACHLLRCRAAARLSVCNYNGQKECNGGSCHYPADGSGLLSAGETTHARVPCAHAVAAVDDG